MIKYLDPTQFRTRLVAILSLTLVLFACDSADKARPVSTLTPDQVAEAAEQARRDAWPKEIRREVYDDPETFSTPRIQFMAELYEDDKSTLWSMRLDGSDRRRVADSELLYEGNKKAVVDQVPVRSPNNRYVAMSIDSIEEGTYRTILDLKEKTHYRMLKGSGRPNFNWTSNSENVIFHTNGKLYNFHVPTKTLKERPDMETLAFFLLPDDKTFVTMQSDGYWLYDFEGNILEKFVLDIFPNMYIKYPAISPNGRVLTFKTSGREYRHQWVDVKTGKTLGNELSQNTIRGRFPFFGDEPYTMFFSKNDFMQHFNLNTLKTKRVEEKEAYIWDMDRLWKFTLINYKASEYYKE